MVSLLWLTLDLTHCHSLGVLDDGKWPQGPAITFVDPLTPSSPQPPSTEGIVLGPVRAPALPIDWWNSPQPPSVASDRARPPSTAGIVLPPIRAPAPPPVSSWARPPAPPTKSAHPSPPVVVRNDADSAATINRLPDNCQTKLQGEQSHKKAATPASDQIRAPPDGVLSFDQFVTAAVVTGLDLRPSRQQRQQLTLLAPSDAYLKRRNVSLPVLALRHMDCVRQIVRTHVVEGDRYLKAETEDIVLSLLELPIFINARDANGVPIVGANIQMDYGLVHVVDGLIDEQRLAQHCPMLALDNPIEHSIILRKVPSDQPFLLSEQSLQLDESPSDNGFGAGPGEDSYLDLTETSDFSTSPEADVPLELLANIDNFAHAMKLTWQAGEDNIIGVLQNLGASTFLALLERSHLMTTLASRGPWTVFAPDNKAWQSLPKDTFDYIMKDPVLLEEILSYHVVPTSLTSGQFNNNARLRSLHRDLPVFINFYTDGWASWYAASGSTIIDLDETASNGVVHVIHSVLFPPIGDLNVTVQSTPALRASSVLLESSTNADLNGESVSLTAFLPMDSPLLNETLSSLDTSMLSDLLERQVVRGTWFVSGLIDGDLLFALNGQTLRVSHEGDCIGINGACIVVRDITLSNGVLHVVDKLFS